MSTIVYLRTPPETDEFVIEEPVLARVEKWTRLGNPLEKTNRRNRASISGAGVLLTLVGFVCFCIFAVKCVIGFLELRYEGIPLLLFDPEQPWWRSIPTWLGKTWLCCAEDFAVAFALLLVGALILKLFSAWSASGRWPRLEMASRWSFWGMAYVAAYAAMAFMILNLFVYQTVDRFLSVKMLGSATPAVTSTVNDASSLARQLVLFMLPLGLISLQLFIVFLLPRFWRWVSFWVYRPVVLGAGLAFFVLLSFLSRTVLGQDYGGFQHNAQLWLVLAPESQPDADFLPGYPAHGGLHLENKPKNVVFIVLESTGHNCMHDYGAPWQTTPNLEQIVEKEHKGILFENAYAISDHTIVSALALFGSMNNHNTENSAIYAARDYPGPNRDFPFPAGSRWMQQHDYRTYFVAAGGQHAWAGYKNLGRACLPYGFDISKDGSQFWSKETPDWGLKGDDQNDLEMFEDAYRCIDDAQQKNQNFFLMLWNLDTHCNYYPDLGPSLDQMPADWDKSPVWNQGTSWQELRHEAPPEGWDRDRFWTEHYAKYKDEIDRDGKVTATADEVKARKTGELNRYLNAISRVDTLIAKLYRDLERRGLADDTLIVITGDHGQAWGHHDTWRHGDKLYDEQCRVPMIFINKHLGEYAIANNCGPRNPVLCSQLDIWPTMMEIVGMPCHPKWQGKSIFNTEISPDKRRVYMWVGGPIAGLREGDYKYVWDKEDGKEYLFNMVEDPDELHDLLKDQPERVEAMHRQLHLWLGWQYVWNEKQLRDGKRD